MPPSLADWVHLADQLDAVPRVAREVIAVAADPRRDLADVEAAIAADPGVSLRVLRALDDPAFGLPRPARDLRDAIGLLGLRDAVAAVVVVAAMACAGGDAPSRRLWHHSLRVALVARLVAEITGVAAPAQAFLAGGLHDLGVRVLRAPDPAAYDAVVDASRSGSDRVEAERRRFGAHHALVGAACLARWRFDRAVIGAVGAHHDPFDPAASGLSAAVRLADALDRETAASGDAEGAIDAVLRTPEAVRLGVRLPALREVRRRLARAG